MAHPGGRPTKWQDEEALEKAINDYFNSTERITLSGLAVYLDIDRKTLYNYREQPKFVPIIKKAVAKVEALYEEMLIHDNKMSCIFPLKNMGWTDKQEIDQKTEHSGGITVKWEEPNIHHTEDQSSTREL